MHRQQIRSSTRRYRPSLVNNGSLGTIKEDILLSKLITETESPLSRKNIATSMEPAFNKQGERDSNKNVSRNISSGQAMALNHFFTKELNYEMSSGTGRHKSTGTTNVASTQIHPRLVRVCGRQSSTSDDSTTEDSDDEILTPFQATRGIVIQPPSYWLGCSYIHRPGKQDLDLTIRQTGIQPDISFSSLKVNVYLRTIKKKKQTVTLLKSPRDNSFRSSAITFKGVTGPELQSADLILKVVAHKLFSRNKVSEMKVDLSNCTSICSKTEWSRIKFSV